MDYIIFSLKSLLEMFFDFENFNKRLTEALLEVVKEKVEINKAIREYYKNKKGK